MYEDKNIKNETNRENKKEKKKNFLIEREREKKKNNERKMREYERFDIVFVKITTRIRENREKIHSHRD